MFVRFMAALAVLSTLATAVVAQVDRSVVRAGDLLYVHVDRFEKYSGEFLVTSDGTISYTNVGRIKAVGQSLRQIEDDLTRSLARIIKDPQVTVSVKAERTSHVYVAGDLTSEGAILWKPGMSLREVIAAVRMPEGYDQYVVNVFRAGEKILTADVYGMLNSGGSPGNVPMEPNDVVSVLSKEYIRAWVTGAVTNPSRVRVPLGSTAHEAVAAAGGPYAGLRLDDEVKIVIHRGDEQISVPALPTSPQDRVVLEPGDSITVVTPSEARISVGGQVVRPNQYSIREGDGINSAIAQAGGPTDSGTLSNVLVIRGEDTYRLDASAPSRGGATEPFQLKDGDFVFVQPNRDFVTVLGLVRNPGHIYFQDGRSYRLSDIVAQANGQASGGSIHRIYVGRAVEGGKLEVEVYQLDMYLKFGDIEQNPEIRPGDVVMVGQPKGITFRDVSRALTSALILDSIIGTAGDASPPPTK